MYWPALEAVHEVSERFAQPLNGIVPVWVLVESLIAPHLARISAGVFRTRKNPSFDGQSRIAGTRFASRFVECTRYNQQGDFNGPVQLEGTCALVERCAGSHHIIHKNNAFPGKVS